MTAPDPTARAALLARLPAVGFVPPEDAAPWSRAARSAAFAAAVEAFAAAYWSLAPDERRERYNRLWNGRYGPAAARLGLLQPGLNAPPGGRAVTAEALIRELATIDLRVHATVPASPPAAGDVVIPRYYGFERSVADAAHALWRVNHKLLACIAAAVLFGVLTLAYAVFSDGPPRPRTTFTAVEVRAYLEYHVGPRAGTRSVPPPGYDDWLAAGKPGARTP